MAFVFGPVAVPLACTGIPSGLGAELTIYLWVGSVLCKSLRLKQTWGGGSGDPAFRCSQVSDNMHKLQLL